MSLYHDKFSKHNIQIAQILMGQAELDSRRSTSHSYNAIKILLKNNVIPIINENDVTSVKELVFGDNDQLAAHITHYFNADMLVILSDIKGYYDKDPKIHSDAKIKKVVTRLSKEELNSNSKSGSKFGTGGIYTKLKAANFLLKRDKEMFLTSGFDLTALEDFLLDDNHTSGTLFRPSLED
ncbi:MAG: Glutamate 5-kinase (EC [uncultured Campylobacterales bacterium]|uniref:Glutamate 5-kinase (EC) n=1 Tax=uncultured Campylobacterales bacterium TaxID=352960 RepID=A0A6S6T9U8_9BACT|nr:MAG: Glutamate 5-kinase (EC [uncultured Campylobacterales bacterium]